jgi:PadR family transcriptional regulator, regulatory protein PadR
MFRRYLTDFELIALLAVLRLGDDAYGMTIARELEQTGRRTVLLGALYAALNRLETNGLVRSSCGESTAVRGGRAKRYFAVTPKGLKAVKNARRSFAALWWGLPQLDEGPTS